MKHGDLSKTASLGADLRALRKSRGLTLSALSDQLGRSVGWLSQVERDMSEPSISDLRQIADLRLASMFFGEPYRGQPGCLAQPLSVMLTLALNQYVASLADQRLVEGILIAIERSL